MKVYTRTGDAGTTSLVSGKRVPKDDIRVEAYGSVDELGSMLALLLHNIKLDQPDIEQALTKAQHKLFNIGAYLADDKATQVYGVSDDDVAQLETLMDQMGQDLPPMKGFILPGGSRLSAIADCCRTTARRAERRIVALSHQNEVDPTVLKYINRLSDFFFIFGRFNNICNQKEEIYWDKNV